MDAYLALFAELVSYCRDRVESVMALQEKLSQLGYRIGRRALDLIVAREKISKRDTRLLSILNFIALTLWTFLYGKQADSLKKVRDSELECTLQKKKKAFASFLLCFWKGGVYDDMMFDVVKRSMSCY